MTGIGFEANRSQKRQTFSLGAGRDGGGGSSFWWW